MEDLYIMAKALKQQQVALRLMLELANKGNTAPGLYAAAGLCLDKADEQLKKLDTHVERG